MVVLITVARVELSLSPHLPSILEKLIFELLVKLDWNNTPLGTLITIALFQVRTVFRQTFILTPGQSCRTSFYISSFYGLLGDLALAQVQTPVI